jgi:hypothetical protein
VSLLWPVTDDAETARLLATGVAQIVTKPINGAGLVEALYAPRLGRKDEPDTLSLVSRAA